MTAATTMPRAVSYSADGHRYRDAAKFAGILRRNPYARSMPERRALRIEEGRATVLEERRIPLEANLQKAFVSHPDVLPSSDLGLGKFTSIGWELSLESGPMDHLVVDETGQVVIVEYKKGTENPDVRTVVAQLLDYGSGLWQTSVEDLERACWSNASCTLIPSGVSIVDHVANVTNDRIDREQFTRSLANCLDTGSFVYLYVARDLDARTRRVLTYLADGAGLRFYAIEVDWFAGGDGAAVVVPRVAFVPAAVAARLSDASEPDPRVAELMAYVDAAAARSSIPGFRSETGRRWGPDGAHPILGVYETSAGVSFWLPETAVFTGEAFTGELREALQALFHDRALPAMYPSFAPSEFLARWNHGGSDIIARLFETVQRARQSDAQRPE